MKILKQDFAHSGNVVTVGANSDHATDNATDKRERKREWAALYFK